MPCSAQEWRIRFVRFYLSDEANLWWATMRNQQYESKFGWNNFKELLKNRFYLVPLQKAKEDEFVHLQQRRMSVSEYASKFMELLHFTPACVVDKKLRINRFKAGLKPSLNERMSV